MAPPPPKLAPTTVTTCRRRIASGASVLWHAAGDTAGNVNKWFIPGLRRFPYFGWQIPFRQERGSVFCRGHSCVGAARTMKLLKTAFWLGVVIYYLPSPASQSGAPASGQGSATKAASQFCTQPLALCKRGESGKRNSSRNAVSQDTLTSPDRAVPWRGSALRIRPVAKRSV
jgi:hypothetical protein